MDDAFANVHLGRFIEVIHSMSYQDTIGLGLAIDNVPSLIRETTERKILTKYINLYGEAVYRFKCTRRTQEVTIDAAHWTLGESQFAAKNVRNEYVVTGPSGEKWRVSLDGAFFFNLMALLGQSSGVDLFFATSPVRDLQDAIKSELANTFYLGPFRQAPQRKYPTRGASPSEVGPMGDSTVTLLANEIVQKRSRRHVNQIAGWLQKLGLAKTLDVARLASSDLFDVKITLEDGNKFPLADLGYGLSQVLPVLTQCSFAPKHSTLLFEQPELHLHAIAARQLATVFVDTLIEKECHVLVETHSPELVKQLCSEINAGRLHPDHVVVYRVSRSQGKSVIYRLPLDFDGREVDIYDNWEKGISVP